MSNYWRKRHGLPVARPVSTSGWIIIAMIAAGVVSAIAGYTVADAFGVKMQPPSFYLVKHGDKW